ncbi:MAG: DUF359 domain-containing protein [Candidatus ainarchaeum sp.]|nr:DUF359 domain-containing protein [Candidatus ainarchaeum sp.]
MKKICEDLKEELRTPFGKSYLSVEKIIEDYPKHKIIAVGDQSVLSFLRAGVKPYVAVFDFKTLRKKIPKRDEEYLKKSFLDIKTIRNLPSTVSRRLVHIVPLFLRSGGALRVYGEEDLTALIFLYFAVEGMVVAYGQKDKGIIIADPIINRKRVEELVDKIIPGLFP